MASRSVQTIRRILSGDLSDFGGPIVSEAFLGRLRAEQMSVVLSHVASMMLVNAGNAAILVAAVWQTPKWFLALLWAG